MQLLLNLISIAIVVGLWAIVVAIWNASPVLALLTAVAVACLSFFRE
jgi:hypothetical protein